MTKVFAVPNYQKPKIAPVVRTESMVLMHELHDNQLKIRQLKRRNQAIKNLLGGQKLVKYPYFDKLIQLYALRLEDGCYYVGMSRNPQKRFTKHGTRKGAVWTREHHPIEILEIRDTNLTDDKEASILEDEMTLEYARQYGTDRVRGGGYCQRNPHWPEELLMPDLSWVA